jgi:glycosyltransferase involved in cell wall biosynthesis
MNSKPLVSVVVITYNQEKYIRQALDSFIAQQTNFPFEVVIGDDCSTDTTADIIKEYAAKYPDIFRPIYRKKNLGAANNSIQTLKEARGKYIALCEGDDFWTDNNKLQDQVDFLEKNKEYSLCFHTVKVFYENNEEKETIWPNLQVEDPAKINTIELLKENFIPTNSVMYRRQSYESLPNNIMPLDWYLHLYHAQFGKIGFVDKTMSAYRRHSNGVWWDSYNDQNSLWNKYGLAFVSMHIELLKICGNNKQQEEIIYNNISSAVINIARADKELKEDKLRAVLSAYPYIAEPIILAQDQNDKNLKVIIDDKDLEIERLNQAIIGLRGDVFKLRDEMHALKNSRLLGKIIKARNVIGTQLPKLKRLPVSGPRHLKRFIADLLPEPIRRMLRKIRRGLTKIIKIATNSYNHIEIKYSVVPNEIHDKDAPLVSVVIPYYNRADTIDDTLRSLSAQSFLDFEIIIVNDGSTDHESIEKLKQLKNKQTDIFVVVDQKNMGVAAARNTGMELARGRYIICLDSDDMLDITYIEKCTSILETNPDLSLITSYMEIFGVVNEPFKHASYDPLVLYNDNMVITAAEFTKKSFINTGGYKSKIGYEDWEHWLNLSENGYWGKTLPERLFKYRTSMQSRYIEDKDVHWNNVKAIRSMHPNYKKIVKQLKSQRATTMQLVAAEEAFVNMNRIAQFATFNKQKKNILITIPWMTFGGAETLIYNYCREIKDSFNISFMTGQKSEHEWEYKFKEITPNVYHLANLFDDPKLHLEFLSNYIKTRNIDVLHAIHNGFTFAMMPELKRRHPGLKIILTLFNDRVPEYVSGAIQYQEHINRYISDNSAVARSLAGKLSDSAEISVIPNGIDSYNEFNLSLFDREKERLNLGLKKTDISIFFVGRLSEEKNPDVFVNAAIEMSKLKDKQHVKFFIVGDGPMKQEVLDQIKSSAIENIEYLGYQSEVARFLSAADMFVLPSKIEGFPLSILEAMAMSVAVIASDVGAVAEVVKSGVDGYVIKPGSVEEIVGIIKSLSSDDELLRSIKKKAANKVRDKYSNKILGSNYQNLYKEIIQ